MNINEMPLAHQEQLINSMTKELNQRFCDDRKVPLKIYSGEIFINRLKLFGEYENCIHYCHEVQRGFGNTQKYFEYYNQVKDKAINYIKESEAFQALNSDDMNKYKSKFNFAQSDIYKTDGIGKRFISIDMKKANFSALVAYGKSVETEFFSSFDYTEFMKQFTDVEHIINSKYIRQVIFGNCNPRRQVTYEKYLMEQLLEKLLNNNIISSDLVKSLCSDEIIIKADTITADTFDKIKAEVDNMCSTVPLRIELFRLGKVNGSGAFIKDIMHNINDKEGYTYILKCVTPDDAPFVYRLINNEIVQDEDKVFNYNGKLAKFIEEPHLEIVY